MAFYEFNFYLAGMITCLIAALRMIWHRDWEGLSVPVILFFLFVISAGCTYENWMLAVAAQQNIDLFH